MSAEYRIEYSIQRAVNGSEEFEEVGFGSSGSWGSIGQAAYSMSSDIDNQSWETIPGMPEPEELEPEES